MTAWDHPRKEYSRCLPSLLKRQSRVERLTEASGGFWQLIFNDDAQARTLFTGESCGLCSHSADFDYGQKAL